MAWSIKAEELAKEYLIRHQHGPRYVALRDVLSEWGGTIFGRARAGEREINRLSREHFWALNDVSFEVEEGERVGIIGRNGAGKSTLLKILSRITDPSRGRAIIRGRVASLLEVGTGFHPELTGRENIYLNGVILGMSKGEIKRKFDEIVAFAEIEKFLDTPVKRYSSGMYVRLAFSVAAHLEAEVLVVDEVLAVGDAQFQKKCLGRMEEIAEGGRTVLFVSHSMPTITSLCRRAILLDGGRVIEDGAVSNVVMRYYGEGSSAVFKFEEGSRVIGDEFAVLLEAKVLDKFGQPAAEASIIEEISIEMVFEITRSAGLHFIPDLHFFRADGSPAFVSSDFGADASSPGIHKSKCIIPANFLNEGTYYVGLALASFDKGVRIHFYELNALCFNVYDPIEGVPTRGGWIGPIQGAVRPILKWHTQGPQD